jgi:hypothetical protein
MVRQTMKKQSRCQCTPTCNNLPLANSPFCKEHLKYCPIKSPLSGNEPEFDPEAYNKHKGIKESLNCFAYAFDWRHLPKTKKCSKNSCPIPFPQPGRASGYPKWSNVKGKRCPDLIARLMGDVPDLKMTTFDKKCPPKTSKIALVVDEDEDYHFYRQDSNGYWSHKPGATEVTHLDATKRPIYNPELASRYYPDSSLHYDQFCSYLCAPKGKKLHFKRGGKSKTRKQQGGVPSSPKRRSVRRSPSPRRSPILLSAPKKTPCKLSTPKEKLIKKIWDYVCKIMKQDYHRQWYCDKHEIKSFETCNLWLWLKCHTSKEFDTHIDLYFLNNDTIGMTLTFEGEHKKRHATFNIENYDIDIETGKKPNNKSFEKFVLAICKWIDEAYWNWVLELDGWRRDDCPHSVRSVRA